MRASMAKKRSGHSLSPCCSVEWLCVMLFIAGANFIRLCSGQDQRVWGGVAGEGRRERHFHLTRRRISAAARACLHPPPSALRLSRHDTNYRFLACLLSNYLCRPTSLCRVEVYSSSLRGDALARSSSSIHSFSFEKLNSLFSWCPQVCRRRLSIPTHPGSLFRSRAGIGMRTSAWRHRCRGSERAPPAARASCAHSTVYEWL